MDDEYILSHGGTEEDIASYAHNNGACRKITCLGYTVIIVAKVKNII